MRRFHPFTAGFLAVLAVAMVPGACAAASLVLGGGMAEDCYKAARANATDRASLDLCTEAIEQEALSTKDLASTLVNRSVILLGRRVYDAAVRDLDRAIQLRPQLAEAYVNRGAARVGLKQYQGAVADLDRGLALGAPEPAKAWYDKGLAHEDLGDLQQAYDDYKKASELRPEWQLPKDEMKRFTLKQG
ncbi:MAG TPA: tetratricopeptide repeat protein [Caulobacteraceae bacterium]|jgi:tetratricopeptide (TPR) repeat protein|nr:tetratricopeptide repeat protein [Caulobacteraceae bacterium]